MAKIITMILGLVSATCTFQPEIVSWKGSGRFSLVTFPSIWLNRPSGGLTDGEKYKVRSIFRNGKESLLFKAISSNGTVSSNQYLVSLTPGVTVESASDADWKAAKELKQYSRVEVEDPILGIAAGHAGASDPPAPEYFVYSGVSYPKSGKIWGHYNGEAPPEKEWLMLFSYSVEEYRQGIWGEVKVPYKGKMYFDIYKIKTGGSGVAPAEAQVVCTFPEGLVNYKSLWVDDRYLIIPVGVQLSSCIIWEMPK